MHGHTNASSMIEAGNKFLEGILGKGELIEHFCGWWMGRIGVASFSFFSLETSDVVCLYYF